MNDLRIEFRCKNAPLYNALKDRFGPISKQLKPRGCGGFMQLAAEQIGVSYALLCDLVALRRKPKHYRGEWGKEAIKIAEFLEEPVEALFPLDIYGLEIRAWSVDVQSEVMISLGEAERQHLAVSLSPDDPQIGLAQSIESKLALLPARTATILRGRFGFDGQPQTLEQLAVQFGLSRDRIRQIEVQGLNKLRHPAVCRELAPFIGRTP